jgi:hypothetical protein
LVGARGLRCQRAKHPKRPPIITVCAGRDCDLRGATSKGEIRGLELATPNHDRATATCVAPEKGHFPGRTVTQQLAP